MAETLEFADIQGIVTRGYGKLRAATYALLEISDAAAARAWLGTLAGMENWAEAVKDVSFFAAQLYCRKQPRKAPFRAQRAANNHRSLAPPGRRGPRLGGS
jgi:hypothetical protein